MGNALTILDEYVANGLYQGPVSIKEVAYVETVPTSMHTIAAQYRCTTSYSYRVLGMVQSTLSNAQWGRPLPFLLIMLLTDVPRPYVHKGSRLR